MSVENSNVIDFVSIDNDGNIALTISDHLEWDLLNEHLRILQDKINTYLQFIESGEIYQSYPDAQGRKFVIKIVALHHPNDEGNKFLEGVKQILADAGYGFYFQQTDL